MLQIAKPSEKDFDTAYELVSILRAIDYCSPIAAPDNLSDFLGSDDFDPENNLHLQVLFNNLIKVIDENPVFYFRVILGMKAVMDSGIIDPDSDYLKLHPRFEKDAEDAARYRQGLAGESKP